MTCLIPSLLQHNWENRDQMLLLLLQSNSKLSLSEGKLLFISNARTWQHWLQSSVEDLPPSSGQRCYFWLKGAHDFLSTTGDSLSSTVSPRSFSGESLPPCWCLCQVLGLSLFEGGEFVEGVPEEGWLPLGFCQGKNLLLRDAGGHSDVALMDRMQALVWGRHRTPVIADTCKRNSFKKAYESASSATNTGKTEAQDHGTNSMVSKASRILPWLWMEAQIKVTCSDARFCFKLLHWFGLRRE